MTELSTDDGPAAVQPSPDWPASQKEVADPLVQRALDHLETLPQAPASEHEAVYNMLHDELLAALNEDPAGSGPEADHPTGGAG
ncbi:MULTISPECIES: hypothetical protein [unclassified Arthrobacter]|uniref:hypothetical protein n=1 Tax=unclassified Arthrobacter TaxID=235627 RepID=UPI001C8504BB|nr:hypothetical protein [Arthrobacter sp. MAHUQ-56]MBX7446134.1 hypothetical protein [Arthrobacter sp. MAHUQ-56]